MTLIPILGRRMNALQFAIAGFHPTNRKTIFAGKLSSCDQSTQNQKSSKILAVGSISKEKGFRPFWNERRQEISSKLWLPTKTDLQDLDLNSSDTSSKEVVENSWFSAKLYSVPKTSSPKTCSVSFTSSAAECMGLEITKSRSVKLYLTKEQRKTVKLWMDTSRFAFNVTIDLLNKKEVKPSWLAIKTKIIRELPEWTKPVPYQIKNIAVKDACLSVQNAIRKFKKTGEVSRVKFRSRKEPTQSCFIPKSAINTTGIYHTILGAIRFTQELPNNPKDSRLIWRAGRLYLKIPFSNMPAVPYGENQARRVCSIDPGIRNFATFFSDSICGHIGQNDFGRIQRLATHADKLVSRMSKAGKQKKRKMKLALHRIGDNIGNLVEELHHKTALFLVRNFELILLPSFETSDMALKSKRKIRSKTVRNMMTFSHYKFKQFLKHKAFEYGKKVVDVCEAYTSKTHPVTGEILSIGGAKTIKLSDNTRIDRDFNGARNILLRALVDSPVSKDTQLTFFSNC